MNKIVCYDSDGNFLDHFTQWDVNQKLIVKGADMSSAPLFHFGNYLTKAALVVQSIVNNDSISANVPNVLLQQASPLVVHMYYSDDDDSAKTKYSIRIPVNPRACPDDYIYPGDNTGGNSGSSSDDDCMNIIVSDVEPNEVSVLWFDTGAVDD